MNDSEFVLSDKILVVDDDLDFMDSVCKALENETDKKVIQSRNGHDAVKKVDSEHPSVIILDQMLPVRSGFLILEYIRNKYKGDLGPFVVMVTANEGRRHKAYAEQMGVDGYI